MTTIYALRETGTDEVRYIGRTDRPLAERLTKHRLNAKHRYPRKLSAWISGAATVEIVPLVECGPDEAARLERRTVEEYHARGHRLTNGHLLPRAGA